MENFDAKKSKKLSDASTKVEQHSQLVKLLEEIQTAIELDDPSIETELEENIIRLEKNLDTIDSSRMLSGPYDSRDAILTLQSGAGGTESQDLTQVLLRMYSRWAERKGYGFKTLDVLMGDVAGIKKTTIRVSGENAYGLLRSEVGVHRFARVSPFDSSKKRQTSFVNVGLLPVLEAEPELKIDKSDIRIDHFRSSGAGGQNVNKVETAVRITHFPSKIVVQCQDSRHKQENKDLAMAELLRRLTKLADIEKKHKLEELAGVKSSINFGSQIRTYTIHSRQVVTDDRTGKEYRPIEKILDGDLDNIIYDYLKSSRN